MSRYDFRKLSVDERQVMLDELIEVLASLKKKEKIRDFLVQLLTSSEIVMISRRWEIARRLGKGESYRRISKEMKIGMSTIQSVDQWLSEAIGNYREKIERERIRKWKKEIKKSHVDAYDSFDSVRHRYGLPFLLVNLLVDSVQEVQQEKLRKK